MKAKMDWQARLERQPNREAIVVQKSFFHHRPSTALGNAPLRGYRIGKNFSGYLYQALESDLSKPEPRNRPKGGSE
jgi:hypothetical protein